MRSLLAQCKAELLRTVRNRRFLFGAVLLPIVFYFIFTGVYGDEMQVGGMEWKAYYLMSMTIFGVIGGLEHDQHPFRAGTYSGVDPLAADYTAPGRRLYLF
ncbi:hypothetical protein LJK88_02025 [Paenibacillus sp. P26]|nr:hypothetical protein LJK88_02025 [Paenibacillus sp. P26]